VRPAAHGPSHRGQATSRPPFQALAHFLVAESGRHPEIEACKLNVRLGAFGSGGTLQKVHHDPQANSPSRPEPGRRRGEHLLASDSSVVGMMTERCWNAWAGRCAGTPRPHRTRVEHAKARGRSTDCALPGPCTRRMPYLKSARSSARRR
jgi:hypothetical protein